MESGRRHGRPDEELFLGSSESPVADSPTVGPLNIRKTSASATNGHQMYQPPYPIDQSEAQPHPPFPPYPDERTRTPASRQATPAAARARTATPETREETRSRIDAAPQRNTSTRVKFEANDPNRPSIHAYTQAPVKPRSERRGGTPKPLPDSPGPETPDKDEPDVGIRNRTGPIPITSTSPRPDNSQQYYPPPGSSGAGLEVPEPAGVNRLSSTASTSTTRAQRGSPPPPETPVGEYQFGGTTGRFAPAAGTAGIYAQNAAASQRVNPYVPANGRQSPAPAQAEQPQRPWSPSERPGDDTHGPTTVYQGMHEVNEQPTEQSMQSDQGTQQPVNAQTAPWQPGQSLLSGPDMQRLNLHEEPPPAYSNIIGATSGASQTQTDEKRAGSVGAIPVAQPQPSVLQDPNVQRHPAFANDPQRVNSMSPQSSAAHGLAPIQVSGPSPSNLGAGPSSPPPLPEGWIAHLDQISGQYYYIHLPTQSTQWEFPKGPTPLNMQEPLSPTGSFINPMASPGFGGFSGKPLQSPGFAPQQTPYRDSMVSQMSMASAVSATPTTTGFTGPPPSAGVDMYKVAPTNGVYFGPYLRYTNIDLERGLWLGSILLITDVANPPTIHLHRSTDLSPNREYDVRFTRDTKTNICQLDS